LEGGVIGSNGPNSGDFCKPRKQQTIGKVEKDQRGHNVEGCLQMAAPDMEGKKGSQVTGSKFVRGRHRNWGKLQPWVGDPAIQPIGNWEQRYPDCGKTKTGTGKGESLHG